MTEEIVGAKTNKLVWRILFWSTFPISIWFAIPTWVVIGFPNSERRKRWNEQNMYWGTKAINRQKQSVQLLEEQNRLLTEQNQLLADQKK